MVRKERAEEGEEGSFNFDAHKLLLARFTRIQTISFLLILAMYIMVVPKGVVKVLVLVLVWM